MAINQSSPGVVFQERDLTSVTQVSSPTTGLIAGPFMEGPIEEIVNINNERELVKYFGEPTDNNFEHFFTAASFLDYGGLLYTVRVDDDALKNACDAGTAPKIKNFDDYEANHEAATNTWKWAARYAGTKGNSIGVFVTDAGADQIAVVPAPASGNEFEFVADEAVTAASGAAGKVFKYSIVLTLTSIVGSFTPGEATTITISSSNETVNVLAYDALNKKLEIELPSGGVTGIIADAQVVTQGTNTAAIAASGIERRLYIGLNKDSVEFAATDSVEDTGSNAAVIESVRNEYLEREYMPGERWVRAAQRPGESTYASNSGGRNDEVHILVVDVDGGITGVQGSILERFIGASKAYDAKNSVGESIYYVNLIKETSNFIWWGEHETSFFAATGTSADGDWGLSAANRQFNLIRTTAGSINGVTNEVAIGSKNGSSAYYRLANGADYALTGSDFSITPGNIETAYELADDPEATLVDFILTGPAGATESAAIAKINMLVNLATERQDCIVFASPLRSNVVGVSDKKTQTKNVIDFMDKLPSSSYMVLDSGYKYIYDKYNDVYRFIPCNGDIAGLCLQTTEGSETWFSPAGLNRGVLRNTIRLAYSPNRPQRDELYNSRVNPVVSFPGQGTVLFGDKTALGRPSAFDRINVRRLFIQLERVITAAAKTQLFEQNDAAQRQLFVNLVEPYLRDVQGRRGIQDFSVKCDEDNNPDDAVDRGEFYAEIFVQPTRTINFISLTFVATRSGIAFEELV